MARRYTAGGAKMQGQEASFSAVPVRGHSGSHVRKVRGLPASVRSGIGLYKGACSTVSNKMGEKKISWIDEFDHFAQLRKVAWKHDSESSLSLTKVIEEYLKKIRELYSEVDSVSAVELDKKLDFAKQEWIREHGSLPEEEAVNGVAQEQENGSGEAPKSSESKLQKNFRKQYEAMLRQIKEDHHPTVYSKPDTPNFEYLCNSIRLMTARKTICFSLDVEAYEFDNDIVTEIGIAIYDPRENVHSLVPMTRNYHLIISEALPLRNKKFVCDFKECFLLGESLVMSLQECVTFVQSLINFYMRPHTDEDHSWSRAFVGHNLQGDLRWMKSLGVKIPDEKFLDSTLQKAGPGAKSHKVEPIFILDTYKLYRFCYGNKGGNLGRLLRLFKIPHAFLHNAGNDSHYTLKLLMHMCDVNFRKQAGMDNLLEMSNKIAQWIDREKQEPKILPMSYALSVVDATKKRPANAKQDERSRKRQAKDLVPQTEFGGSHYFVNARDAFESTLQM